MWISPTVAGMQEVCSSKCGIQHDLRNTSISKVLVSVCWASYVSLKVSCHINNCSIKGSVCLARGHSHHHERCSTVSPQGWLIVKILPEQCKQFHSISSVSIRRKCCQTRQFQQGTEKRQIRLDRSTGHWTGWLPRLLPLQLDILFTRSRVCVPLWDVSGRQ